MMSLRRRIMMANQIKDFWEYNVAYVEWMSVGEKAGWLLSPLVKVNHDSPITFCGMNPSAYTIIGEYNSEGKQISYWGNYTTEKIGEVDGYPIYKRTITLDKEETEFVRIGIKASAYNYCNIWQGDIMIFDGSKCKPKQ